MKRALLLLALVSSCNGSNAAKPAALPTFVGSAEIDKARALLAEGKHVAGTEALAEALRIAESAAPLRIASLVVAQDARGYGVFVPDSDSTITPNGTLLLYFEPIGFDYGRQEGLFLIDLTADLAILDAKGTVLEDEPEALTLRTASRRPNREIQLTLRRSGKTIPEGDYVARITLKDRIGGESAVEQVTFKVKTP